MIWTSFYFFSQLRTLCMSGSDCPAAQCYLLFFIAQVSVVQRCILILKIHSHTRYIREGGKMSEEWRNVVKLEQEMQYVLITPLTILESRKWECLDGLEKEISFLLRIIKGYKYNHSSITPFCTEKMKHTKKMYLAHISQKFHKMILTVIKLHSLNSFNTGRATWNWSLYWQIN